MAATDESRALLSTLESQRRHVLGILDGLSDTDLHRPVLPSGWSCLAVVRHLALDVERFWFDSVMAGHGDDGDRSTGDPDNAWRVDPAAPATAVFALYRTECERSTRTFHEHSMETTPRWWPKLLGDWRMETLREVTLHVITETATHAGHLDAARELIDGRQWQVIEQEG